MQPISLRKLSREKLETESFSGKGSEKDASASFAQETDKIFFNKASDMLVKSTNFELPDEFLKRWLLEYNEGKYTRSRLRRISGRSGNQ